MDAWDAGKLHRRSAGGGTARRVAVTCGCLLLLLAGESGNTVAGPHIMETAQFSAPQLKWAWTDSEFGPASTGLNATPVVIDLNQDGVPEVVFLSTHWTNRGYRGTLRAVRGTDGSEVLSTHEGDYLGGEYGLAVGDIDNDGFPEIIARSTSDTLVAFEHDGTHKWTSPDLQCWGNVAHAAIADIDHDGNPEIVICATVLNNDGTIRWQHRPVSVGRETVVADIDLSGNMEIIDGRRVYASDGSVLCEMADDRDIHASAVANLDDDPYAEIIMIGRYAWYAVDHDCTVKWKSDEYPHDGGVSDVVKGSPIIADLDGDGEPEIGLAAHSRYTVYEKTGRVKWSVPVGDFYFPQGASAADLNGNGMAEIIFHGSDGLVIFRGVDGRTLWEHRSSAGATTFPFGMPIVADVDGDGHAEIVSNWTSNTNAPGIQVFGHESWMPMRSVWNQHSYHITNINSDGTIPRNEEPNWLTHNNYRTNGRLEGSYPPTWSALLPIGLAETGVSEKTPKDVIIAVDVSGSMAGPKLVAAKTVIRHVLNQVSWPEDQVALVVFSEAAALREKLTGDRKTLEASLDDLGVSPGTRIDEGLRVSRQELSSARGRGEDATRIVVVLTDGLQESGGDRAIQEAAALHDMGVRLLLVGLGADVDRDLLARLAGVDGRSYVAINPEDLDAVYEVIGRTLSCVPRNYWGRRCY